MQPLPLALFTSPDGNTRLEIRLEDETLWLTQKQIAELFEKSPKTISEHLQNIYDEAELRPEATIRKFRTVAREGARDVERLLDHYNLDAVMAVGFRVRSNRGTQFRQWANQVLKEYLIKGFAMDDERLKNPEKDLKQDYFDELLSRIRDIRASERRFYQKITDIYATATDYNPKAETSQMFFATVQNKMHWAIHGHTAAELIHDRADSSKPNMGLSTWQGQHVSKKDVSVAKNYLSDNELSELNRVVVMYLDYAEDQAQKQQTVTMEHWADKLDKFLAFNERNILQNAGSISKEVAQKLAETEYEKYAEQQRLEQDMKDSDFDKFVQYSKQIENKKK